MRVYYNLHKKCLSVMDKKTRRVIAHVNFISLNSVRFIVSAAGLARVRRQRRKGVIAFVEGDYTTEREERIIFNPEWVRVYFNPYEVDQFMVGELPVYEAGQAYIVDKNIYIKETQCATC